MNNFLYIIFSTLLGDSILTIRLFSLSISLFFVFSYFKFIEMTSNQKVAFFSATSLLLLPIFNIQSISFYNEIGSLAFALTSLIFFKKQRLKLFSFFGVIAILYLESTLAFYASIAMTALMNYLKVKAKKKTKK